MAGRVRAGDYRVDSSGRDGRGAAPRARRAGARYGVGRGFRHDIALPSGWFGSKIPTGRRWLEGALYSRTCCLGADRGTAARTWNVSPCPAALTTTPTAWLSDASLQTAPVNAPSLGVIAGTSRRLTPACSSNPGSVRSLRSAQIATARRVNLPDKTVNVFGSLVRPSSIFVRLGPFIWNAWILRCAATRLPSR